MPNSAQWPSQISLSVLYKFSVFFGEVTFGLELQFDLENIARNETQNWTKKMSENTNWKISKLKYV